MQQQSHRRTHGHAGCKPQALLIGRRAKMICLVWRMTSRCWVFFPRLVRLGGEPRSCSVLVARGLQGLLRVENNSRCGEDATLRALLLMR